MSPLRARPGLLVCAALGVFVFLYLRDPTAEEPGEGPPRPPVVECGYYPDELCSALFAGKEAAPQVAKFCKNPQGSEIGAHFHAPGNCSRLTRGLRFITRPLSAEEGNFSLAYIITFRKELAVLVQLLRAIYAPQNVYCIHVDEKAPRKQKAAVQALVSCFENMLLSPRSGEAAASGPTRLQADLGCMRALARPALRWSHVLNLCGQDFPIKTNKEIVHYIRSRWRDKNITPGVAQPPNNGSTTSPGAPEAPPDASVYAAPGQTLKEPPHNLTVYFGSAYYVLTRKFVEFVLTDTRAKDMLQWSAGLRSPERLYWATLNRLKDAPGTTPHAGWEGDVRAVKRRNEEGKGHDGCKGHYVQDSCVYGPGDLPWIIQSPSLFANQFEASSDPLVVTCLARRHRLRVLRAAEVPVEPHWRFDQEGHFDMKLSAERRQQTRPGKRAVRK
ncbi:PREDICTED: beta-1,3-galactosyl-O-glycosyl-glycoprotein beta-1,6-N-acetylglucosaminyltransferase 7 [Condylura cristata]|uniref:beta-1,3-galactosyl-O-glycosyl-glycoprotein beta-1,6-N-acetylglucosaminyltransferase 7 n=1 Tax=Condylura cristata TaxID=143302 RepID=UPI000642988C|nr:PREDICTED: beta-1,3-galactosyl-O-glycosyl-glycoprotein beta-1,6-N-acetylglucosaminyltransferase 7 [Condylura cristata]